MDPVTGMFLAAMLLSGVITKWIQDGRTDRSYAQQGMVSPRHQVRLDRLAAAGRPASPKERGPLRNLLSEYYADAMLDLQERHRAKRAVREPYDPTRPSLARRFDGWVLDRIERAKASQGWDAAKAAGRLLWDPVGERTGPQPEAGEELAEGPEDMPAPPAPHFLTTTPPRVGERDTQGRTLEWTGAVWAPVCSRCDRPMATHDRQGWLTCGICGVRAVDDRVPEGAVVEPGRFKVPPDDDNAGYYDPAHLSGAEGEDSLVRQGRCPYQTGSGGWGDPLAYCGVPRSPHDADHPYCNAHAASIRDDRGRGGYVAPIGDVNDHRPIEGTNDTPTGGTMTGIATEASTYETASVALNELTTAAQNLSDHVAGAVAAADTFATHVEEISAAKREVADAVSSIMDQLAGKGVDANTQGRINDALEMINTNDLDAALDHVDGAKTALAASQTAATEATATVWAAQESLDETYGEIAATMAAHGTDGSFVDGGGGSVPAGGISASGGEDINFVGVVGGPGGGASGGGSRRGGGGSGDGGVTVNGVNHYGQGTVNHVGPVGNGSVYQEGTP